MDDAMLTVGGLRVVSSRRTAAGMNELSVLVNGSMVTSIPVSASVAAARHHLSAPGIGKIGIFEMPPMKIVAGDGVTLRDVAGTMLVSDEEAVRFQRVTTLMLNQTHVVFHCSAKLDVSFTLLFLPISFSGLSLEKNLQVPAMAGLTQSLLLKGFTLAESDTEELRINANVTFVNPSPIAVGIGELVLGYSFAGFQMGSITIADASIEPGLNLIAIAGTFNPENDPGSLEAAAGMCQGYLAGHGITVAARVGPNASKTIFYNEILSGLEFPNVTVNPHAKPMVKRVDFGGITMTAAGTGEELDFSVSVGVSVNNPLPGAATLEMLATTVNASLEQLGGGEVLSMQGIPVRFDHVNEDHDYFNVTLKGRLDPARSGGGFATFVQSFIHSDAVSASTMGRVDSAVRLSFGTVKLQGIPMQAMTRI